MGRWRRWAGRCRTGRRCKVSKRLTITIRPEHALQYMAMFRVLADDTTHRFHPDFKAAFEDWHDMIRQAAMSQLSAEEIKKAARL